MISCTVTVQLICVFDFCKWKKQLSHEAPHMIATFEYSNSLALLPEVTKT